MSSTTTPTARPSTTTRRGYGRPRPASLDEAMSAAGLTDHEQHVVRQRLPGRSHQEIATDAEMRKADGASYTRQRLQQMERDALAKLGAPRAFSVASVHADDAADRAERLRERAGLVCAADLNADGEGPARRRQRDAAALAELELDALADQFIREAESGMTARRADQYRRKAERLARV